jgi:murein DD-endopeptidase MepM/ murein hydrolase activator NlpD
MKKGELFFLTCTAVFLVFTSGCFLDKIGERITGFPGEVLPYNGGKAMPLRHIQIASFYGERIDPITNEQSFHSGIDLVSQEGYAVYAVLDGVIYAKDYNPTNGNFVQIQHPDGSFTLYLHMSAFGNISVGQEVGSGSVIGAVGNTGRSTGAHLHFAMFNDRKEPMDPSEFLGIKNPGNPQSNFLSFFFPSNKLKNALEKK